MESSAPRWARAVVVAAVLLAAVWPWWPMLDVLPQGADATKWVGRADLSGDWVGWVLNRKHFVGYRPVTALSFVLNHATTGYAAWGYRVTDIGLHAVGALLALALHRRWFGGSWIATGVVGAVLLAHPAIEEVVPVTSRRSYLLASDFGLLALLLHGEALSATTRARRWGLGALTAASTLLAVTSNEVAYVFVPLIVLRTSSEAWRALPAVAGPSVVAAAVAVGLRAAILDSVAGGYQKRYFAFLGPQGVPAWVELPDWQPGRIALAAIRYLFLPNGPSGEGPLLPVGLPQDLGAGLIGAWVLAAGALLPAMRWRDPEARRRLLLVAWLVGSAGIVVLSQTWFWRQAFTLVFPLALLAGATVGDALRTGRRGDRLVAGGAALLLAASLPFGSAFGLHTGSLDAALRMTALVEAVEALPLSAPSTVWLVAAEREQTAQIARIWLDRRSGRPARKHRVLAAAPPHSDLSRARASLATDARGVRHLSLRALGLVEPQRFDGLRDRGQLRIDALWRRNPERGHRTWLVLADGAGPARAEELVRPTDGVLYRDSPRELRDDEPDTDGEP